MTSLKYPPGILICSRGDRWHRVGDKAPAELEAFLRQNLINTFVFAPSTDGIRILTGQSIPTVESLYEDIPPHTSDWSAIVTIAGRAFRIQNGMSRDETLSDWFKRLSLLFDRIAVYDLAPALCVLGESRLAAELEWLIEKDVICQPVVQDREHDNLSEEYTSLNDAAMDEVANMIQSIHSAVGKVANGTESIGQAFFQRIADSLELATWAQTRAAAVWFGSVGPGRVVPIVEKLPANSPGSDKSTPTLQMVINAFPMLDSRTSWEQVLDFRADPANRRSLVALRRWANETARLEIASYEIADRLEGLLEEYRERMRLANMKFQNGRLDVLVTAGAECLKELGLTTFSKAAKARFSVRELRVNLLQAELDSPGSEVAYILKAHEI